MAEETKATQAGAGANDEGQQEVKTYTQEEVDAMLQKETDKRVTSAIKKNDAKWQSELDNQLQEAERLAKLSAEEKETEAKRKERETFETERAEFERERLKFGAEKELREKGLPTEFASFLTRETAEGTLEAISTFEAAFRQAVEASVKEKIASSTPGASGGKQTLAREEIAKNTDASKRHKLLLESLGH